MEFLRYLFEKSLHFFRESLSSLALYTKYFSIDGLAAVVEAAVVGIGPFMVPVESAQANHGQSSVPTVNSVSLNGVLDNTPQQFDFNWNLSFYWYNYLISLNPLSGTDWPLSRRVSNIHVLNIESGAGSDEWFEI